MRTITPTEVSAPRTAPHHTTPHDAVLSILEYSNYLLQQTTHTTSLAGEASLRQTLDRFTRHANADLWI